MGMVDVGIWKCSSCGHEFFAQNGLCEFDPNDFGTTHFVTAHYCPKCRSVKNLAFCVGLDKPKEGNEDSQVWDSDRCENCNTKMKELKKPIFKFFSKNYRCPECNKKTLKYTGKSEDWMT